MQAFKTLAVLLLAAFMLAGCEKPQETASTEFDKAEMAQAVAEAQATFDEFLARARNPQPGDEAFNVKVKLSNGKNTEHLWVGDLKLDKEPYEGKLTMDAEILNDVKAGYLCRFVRAEVTDWMYMSNGKMQGNRTLRVLMKSMPPEKAADLKQKLGM